MVVTEMGSRKKRSKNGFLRSNSLSLVCFGLFAIFVVGLLFTGFRNHNAEQQAHDQPELSLGEYATSGTFWEALTENWESEYLQMAAYVILTVFLIQKGSSESKDPEKAGEDVDQDPERAEAQERPLAGAPGRSVAPPLPELAVHRVPVAVPALDVPPRRQRRTRVQL